MSGLSYGLIRSPLAIRDRVEILPVAPSRYFGKRGRVVAIHKSGTVSVVVDGLPVALAFGRSDLVRIDGR
jgi:hypothetical protein